MDNKEKEQYTKVVSRIVKAMFANSFAEKRYANNIGLYHNIPIHVTYLHEMQDKYALTIFSKDSFTPYIILLVTCEDNTLFRVDRVDYYYSYVPYGDTSFDRLKQKIGKFNLDRIHYLYATSSVVTYYRYVWKHKYWNFLKKKTFNALANF